MRGYGSVLRVMEGKAPAGENVVFLSIIMLLIQVFMPRSGSVS
jgi:hypothetical protein